MIFKGNATDVLETINADSIDTCITSPPYWNLRDYGVDGQIGLEDTPEMYVERIVEVFREVKRVLKPEGTLWLNLGDSYATSSKSRTPENAIKKSTLSGSMETQTQSLKQKSKVVGDLKNKDLVGIPWMVAFALRADGWFLRQDIIWSKTNPMPESVTDRCTKAHEYVFLLSKSQKYYFNHDAIKEPAVWGLPNSPNSIKSPHGQGFSRKASGGGHKHSNTAVVPGRKEGQNLDLCGQKVYDKRNKRSVWTVATAPFKGAHFATFPQKLIEPMILAGCPKGGTVLDPFSGAGTTWLVSKNLGRKFIGAEINEDYIKMAYDRVGEKSGQ